MKKMLAFVLTVILTLSFATPAMAKAELRGVRDEFPDVNMDGELNVNDVSAILRYVCGRIELNDIDREAADRDGDSYVTSYDARLLVLWLQENGYLGRGGASKSRLPLRTNYNLPEAIAECPFVATYYPDEPVLDIVYLNRKKPTNGLVSVQWDPEVTSTIGIGFSDDCLIEFREDDLKHVIHIAYVSLLPAERDYSTVYVGFWIPEEDTEFVCQVHQRNQSLFTTRTYHVRVQGQ